MYSFDDITIAIECDVIAIILFICTDNTKRQKEPFSTASYGDSHETHSRPTLTDKPTPQQLQVLKTNSEKRVRVIDCIAVDWEEVAIALGFEPPHIDCVKRDYIQNAKGACRQILTNWLNGETNQDMPITWETLIQCLIDAGQVSVAEDLRQILC